MAGYIRVGAVVVVGCMCVYLAGVSVDTAAAGCPNERFRVGRSAELPDCRAYELVTPPELGRTEDMLFENGLDATLVAGDGEHLALEAKGMFVEPGVSIKGTIATFSRTSTGWVMSSLAAPGMASDGLSPELFSPGFSQVAIRFSSLQSGAGEGQTLATGAVGGPYSTVASIPGATAEGQFVGANAGTPSVPAFSDVIFVSSDYALLPPGPERQAAEQTEPGRRDLYEWANNELRLVNMGREGKLVGRCGALPGLGVQEGNALDAISADGSKIFYTSPEETGTSCQEPQLYMRNETGEIVDVSEPQGVSVEPSARSRVEYDGASADGSRVFFTSATGLTPGAGSGFHLYEYDVGAPVGQRLKLVANEVAAADQEFFNPSVVVSEDGSAVYYNGVSTIKVQGHAISVSGIWRYETATGRTSFVAVPVPAIYEVEPAYATPGGKFFLFPAGNVSTSPVEVVGPHGLEPEVRGAGHDELYRFDATTGSVMCVSCGEGTAPVKGHMLEPRGGEIKIPLSSYPPGALAMSDNGQRVFFQTSARLTAQDTNESSAGEETVLGTAGGLGVGADVYEWEEAGTEEAPGVFCGVANGCTHLISAGEAVGPERFLGASANGENVFFISAAQLVPQATPEFTNIYDARVDGGFLSPSPRVECTACQGVGSPPLGFGAPTSGTFAGAGNRTIASPPPPPAPKCAKGEVRRGSRCIRIRRKPSGKRSGRHKRKGRHR